MVSLESDIGTEAKSRTRGWRPLASQAAAHGVHPFAQVPLRSGRVAAPMILEVARRRSAPSFAPAPAPLSHYVARGARARRISRCANVSAMQATTGKISPRLDRPFDGCLRACDPRIRTSRFEVRRYGRGARAHTRERVCSLDARSTRSGTVAMAAGSWCQGEPRLN